MEPELRDAIGHILLSRSYRYPGGCRVYEAPRGDRYGRFMYRGQRYEAHRAAYMLCYGDIPPGHHVHHKCGNRLCVDPAHLEAVSPRDHVLSRHPDSLAANISAARRERARRNRAKTHCVNGHEFTPENTYVRKEGWRQCRACLRERSRRRIVCPR